MKHTILTSIFKRRTVCIMRFLNCMTWKQWITFKHIVNLYFVPCKIIRSAVKPKRGQWEGHSRVVNTPFCFFVLLLTIKCTFWKINEITQGIVWIKSPLSPSTALLHCVQPFYYIQSMCTAEHGNLVQNITINICMHRYTEEWRTQCLLSWPTS